MTSQIVVLAAIKLFANCQANIHGRSRSTKQLSPYDLNLKSHKKGGVLVFLYLNQLIFSSQVGFYGNSLFKFTSFSSLIIFHGLAISMSALFLVCQEYL